MQRISLYKDFVLVLFCLKGSGVPEDPLHFLVATSFLNNTSSPQSQLTVEVSCTVFRKIFLFNASFVRKSPRKWIYREATSE